MEKRIARLQTAQKPKTEKTMRATFGEKDFSGDVVFQLKNLQKGYGDRTLFSNVELKVEGGERIALIGDNGTGKSTLIKRIMEPLVIPAIEDNYGIVVKGQLTVQGGIHNQGVKVGFTIPEDATVYYTMDGSEPTATNGIVYTGQEIELNFTTVLRANMGDLDPQRMANQTVVCLAGLAVILLYHGIMAVWGILMRRRDPAQKLRK